MDYTILTKREGYIKVTICDVFDDNELWKLFREGWVILL